MYKNNDLQYLNLDNHFKSNSEFLNFTQEKTNDKNLNLMEFGHTGSQYVNMTNHEFYDYKFLNLMEFGHTGSQHFNLTDNYEFYDYKNLDIYEGFNYYKSGSEAEKLKWTHEVDNPKNLHIFDIHNFYKSGSESQNLRWIPEMYKNNDLYIFDTDKYYKSSSTSEFLTFNQEMYKNNDLHIFDVHNYWTSGSDNLVQFNNYKVDSHNFKFVNIVDDFNSNKDGEYVGFDPEMYTNRDGNLSYNVNVNNDIDKSDPITFVNNIYDYNDMDMEVSSITSSNPEWDTDIFLPYVGTFNFSGNTTFYEHVFRSFSDLNDSWGKTENDTKFLHYGYSGSDGDYNTYHYEKRYVFYTIGDVESISGSHESISSSFETDFTGTVTSGIHTASKDFKNKQFIKIGEFLGERPMGTTSEFVPTGSISFKGGKMFDETFVYPPNHNFVVGSSKDSINRLIYKGSKNVGGDEIVSEIFTDLDSGKAFYHILITGGGNAPTVNN